MQLNRPQGNRGFTLIEVLVSMSIFTIVMLVATGSIFSIIDANKKTHSLKSVMTNLNFALESMTRDIRVGTGYVCNGTGDCPSGGTTFRYLANRSLDSDSIHDQVEYSSSGGSITKKIYYTDGTPQSTFNITAAEITITNLKFYLIGSAAGDGQQPKVLIVIQGYSGSGRSQSNFNIQTTVSMRSIDS